MSSPQSVTAPAHRLVDQPDEITHLVCCRDESWRTAFCGASDLEEINHGALHYCSMCMEEAERMRPGWLLEPDGTCPVDGRRCPTGAEYDALVERMTR
jgi:hypothetical protein